jgi:hypothetical protein
MNERNFIKYIYQVFNNVVDKYFFIHAEKYNCNSNFNVISFFFLFFKLCIKFYHLYYIHIHVSYVFK